MNEPAESPPYDTTTLEMEVWAYYLIRGHAPETHILLMSYSNPVDEDSVLTDLQYLTDKIDWSNAFIAFHTYGIGFEFIGPLIDSIKQAGYAITCTEPKSLINNKYTNIATTRIFEDKFVSYLHFIKVNELGDDPSLYQSLIESSEIRWMPDFGNQPNDLEEISYRNPYNKTNVQFFDDGFGFQDIMLTTAIGYIHEVDYIGFYNFNFGEGPDSLILEYASNRSSGADIEMHIDSVDGFHIVTFHIESTGTWDVMESQSFPVKTLFNGIHKFCFVFRGLEGYGLMNFKAFTFKQYTPDGTLLYIDSNKQILIYPNPAKSSIWVEMGESATIEIYSVQGQLLMKKKISDIENMVPVDGLSPGNYVIRILNNSQIYSHILTIE